MKHKLFPIASLVMILSLVLGACGPAPTPEKIIETVVVPGTPVEKVVEKVVTATPEPQPQTTGNAVTLNVLSEENSPESQAFYRSAVADFEKSHPGVHIVLDFPATAADALVIRIASGNPPDIATAQLEAQLTLADAGLLETSDWWMEKHSADLVENANVPYKGHYYGIPYALTCDLWWYRKDLFDKANMKPPDTWADMLAAAKYFNDPAKGMYGIGLPAGHSEWTAWHYEWFLWQNGGFVFDTNLKPTVNSKESIETLSFMKELYQYAPPDAATWEWWDSITGFVQEHVAMSEYGGRMLVHTNRDNPPLAQYTKTFGPPLGEIRATYNGFKAHVILKSTKHPELAKEFLEFLSSEKYLVPFVLTVPMHLIPPLKSIGNSEAFKTNPLILSHADDMANFYAAMKYGRSLGWESPNHPPNPYSGALNNSYILVDMVQKVLLKNESPEDATAWAQAEIEKLIQQIDASKK